MGVQILKQMPHNNYHSGQKKMADVESGNMKKSASLQDVLGSKSNLKTDSVFR